MEENSQTVIFKNQKKIILKLHLQLGFLKNWKIFFFLLNITMIKLLWTMMKRPFNIKLFGGKIV